MINCLDGMVWVWVREQENSHVEFTNLGPAMTGPPIRIVNLN